MDTAPRSADLRRFASRVVLAGVAAALALVTSVTAAGKGTGSLSGEVLLQVRSTARLDSPGAYPDRGVRLAATHDVSEMDNVVVFVKTGPKATATPGRATVRQQDTTFVPHIVPVTTGSRVEFPNDDLVFHNVFSLSRGASFDLGRYPRGDSRHRTFDKPGIVKVFCRLHSHMSAVVFVFDHPHFTKPDRSGRFSLDGLAPGRYDVVAWHERVGEVTRSVTITAGEATAVSFSLPMGDS